MNETYFRIITPNDLIDYHDQTNDIVEVAWPEFMLQDPVAEKHWHNLFTRFGEYQFALLDTRNNRMAAMGNSLPFHWEQPVDELPEGGWDWVFLKAIEDHEAGKEPNIQSAIQVAIHTNYQNQGLSTRMVQNMRAIGQAKGFKTLVAPVRPSQKSLYPLTSIDDYITWTNDAGLPFDAWLRVHARLGARIIKPCHEAMAITGTRAEWETWTGLKFPKSGTYSIPGALTTIEISLEKDEGIYIEPNVWMAHTL